MPALMDTLYSALLALALGALGVASGFATFALLRGPGRTPWRSLRHGALAALGFASASALVHVGFGHRPGTPTGLGPLDFVSEHRALSLVLFSGFVLLLAATTRERRA